VINLFWLIMYVEFQAMWNLNNFAGMFVINAALESASVFRLRSTLRVSILACT